jgi:2-polyprenyl-3-methyl-5-hydroxy-6-metoxy-1,4-benzoquinol methylase
MQPLLFQSADRTPILAWDECVCHLCGNAEHAPLLEAADPVTHTRFLIVRCKRCSLSFTNPRPDAVSIHPFYPEDYRCHQRQTGKRYRRHNAHVQLLPPHGQRRLLDVGCGAGRFLERMHALGWNVIGLDTSEVAVARIRECGFNAHVGTLPQSQWSDASFDAITLWQSLEHMHQPLEALQEVHRLLTPAGTLIVAVPNFDSWAALHFGSDWYGLDLPRHLTHFTPETLRGMLQQTGFTHIDLRQESHHSWIRHSAERQRGALAWLLRARLGSSLAGWWAAATGRADGLLVCASKA